MSFNSKHKSREIEEILDSVEGKQDAISDLEKIRQGAAKGATALQSLSNYYTKSEVDSKIATSITNAINASY